MATLRPFAAIRPSAEKASEVAALPYDVMDSGEARVMTEGHPYSFLRVDRAEVNFPEGQDPYAPEVYEKAASLLRDWLAEGILVREESPCFYIYRLTMDGRAQTGIVGCAAVAEYEDGTIKKHELTRREKEEDRVRHVDTCSANTGPIFLTYRKKEEISAIVAAETAKKPLYDFTAEDGIGHTVWRVAEEETIRKIAEAFEQVPAFYIADGHHRCASACRVGKMRRGNDPEKAAGREDQYFLSVLFPDKELKILGYYRIVRDLNGLTPLSFLLACSTVFSATEEEEAVVPSRKGEFGLYLDGKWYRLKVRESRTEGLDSVDGLDVSILAKELLSPVLGIGDPRTDPRIDFVGGIRGTAELEKRVNEHGGAAFTLFPVSVDELMRIADDGKIMPPKSTWFEPKLRSGLFIHSLNPEGKDFT